MSQSPAEALYVQRYEDGWEVINRMIREDLSWGGRERNCLHAALPDGTFANISAASGADFEDDGRALGVLDVDRDGRPDLALRNRTAPLLRILRNTWPEPGESLWLRLEGAGANRDAIGARIHVHTLGGVRIKEVKAGDLFLSQSSRWIPFGVAAERQARVTVRWPGGSEQDLGVLQTGRRYVVREGGPAAGAPYEPIAGFESSATRRQESSLTDGERPPREAPSGVATWLIEPVPAPRFALAPVRPVTGSATPPRVGPADFLGKPLFLHFVSITCGVCLSEAPAVRRAETLVEKGGATFLHIVVNPRGEPEDVRSFVERARYSAPAVQADERTLRAYSVLHRQIWNLRRDLAVPTTFLLDAAGAVVRVYRGSTQPETLAVDVSRLPRSPAARLDLALAFPGTLYKKEFRRDLLALGNAYLESGLEDLARETFQAGVRFDDGDVDSIFNFAVASARAGDLETAAESYRKVIELGPGSDDARNNLAVLLAQRGETREAERLFRTILERNPAHGEAPLNLGRLLLEERRHDEAIGVLRDAAVADPESAVFRRHLGVALFRSGRPDEALESLRTSLVLDPLDEGTHLEMAILLFSMKRPAEAKAAAESGLRLSPRHPPLLNALGMIQLELGATEAGIASLEGAIRADPKFDRAYLNLARFYRERGRPDAEAEVIGRLLKEIPGHPVGEAR